MKRINEYFSSDKNKNKIIDQSVKSAIAMPNDESSNSQYKINVYTLMIFMIYIL